MAGESKATIDHKEIKKWVEERGGKPARVAGTGDGGVLRINFPGYSGEDTLEEISWDDFFKVFEDRNLAFLYQDETADTKESRFFKFISRNQPFMDEK